jgi:hypothetical protein
MSANPFAGRRLVIATQHRKEQVIAPALESALGVTTEVAAIDTDQFGTFAGERPRTVDPLEAARLKCRAALEATGATLAVASEGSFIPHPAIGFVPADEEILLLMDAQHGWEIAVKRLSTETNFSGEWVTSTPALQRFAQRAGFPSHGLILRAEKDGLNPLHKGLVNAMELEALFASLHTTYGGAWVETDMRAHLNPTRMKVIAEAAAKLAEAALSPCPQCLRPGFVVVDAEEGLPCAWCGSPTHATLAHLLRCSGCSHEQRLLFPKGRTQADPQNCDNCNP